MSNIYFTSDIHFGHKNIITYCNRPYRDTHEMNEAIIDNWNSTVKPEDTVYVVGDFSFQGRNRAKETCNRLNGTKILVLGNHDRGAAAMLEMGFAEAHHKLLYTLPNGVECNVSHYPYKGLEHDDRKTFRDQLEDDGKILIHGHTHQAEKVKGRLIHVGVDAWNYAPVSEHELARLVDDEILTAGDSS